MYHKFESAIKLLFVVVVSLLLLFLVHIKIDKDIEFYSKAVGMEIEPLGDKVVVTYVTPNSPADRAGIEKGDILLEIDGNKVDYYTQVFKLVHEVSKDTFLIKVERDGVVHSFTLTRGMVLPLSRVVFEVVVILIYGCLAILVILVGKSPQHFLLALFAISVAIEFVISSFASASKYLAFLEFLLLYIQFVSGLHFLLFFPKKHFLLSYRSTLPLLYFLPIMPVIYLLWNLFYSDDKLFYSTMGISRIVLYAGAAVAVVTLLYYSWRNSTTKRERTQIIVLMLGLYPWALVSIYLIFAYLLGIEVSPLVGMIYSITLLIIPIMAFISISRYNFFNLEAFAKRIIIYFTLFTIAIGIFTTVLMVGGVLLNVLDPLKNTTLVGFASFITGLSILSLKKFIEEEVTKKFFATNTSVRKEILKLAIELPSKGTLLNMGRYLAQNLSRILGVRPVRILVTTPGSNVLSILASFPSEDNEYLEHSVLLTSEDKSLKYLKTYAQPQDAGVLISISPRLKSRLRNMGASLLVPLIYQDKLLGLIVLGKKLNGEEWTEDEKDLLALFSNNVASIFETAAMLESVVYDSLTGVFRREKITELLAKELHRANRYRRPLAVAMVDLDHFKKINDTYGHLVGDGVLKWVAHLMKKTIRKTDYIGRYGGEEFLLVFPETALKGALVVAEKVRSVVESNPYITPEGEEIKVTISIGVAVANRDPSKRDFLDTIDSIVTRADKGLYRSKREGRNKVSTVEGV